MPFPVHQVEPVRMSDKNIPDQEDNKLESVTNVTLCQVKKKIQRHDFFSIEVCCLKFRSICWSHDILTFPTIYYTNKDALYNTICRLYASWLVYWDRQRTYSRIWALSALKFIEEPQGFNQGWQALEQRLTASILRSRNYVSRH